MYTGQGRGMYTGEEGVHRRWGYTQGIGVYTGDGGGLILIVTEQGNFIFAKFK